MEKERMLAFSDGVIAVIITIMVLELKAPPGDSLDALRPLWPVFLSYILSFIFIGIYWNNHHHLMHVVRQVDGAILWANLHLLFWLSLVPFVTAWMGGNHFGSLPVALYGVVMLMAAVGYTILVQTLIARHGKESILARAIGKDWKGKVSLALYLTALPLSFVNSKVSLGLYVVVAILWLVPDRRMEKLPR
jgi:uncharacterized membrane protein